MDVYVTYNATNCVLSFGYSDEGGNFGSFAMSMPALPSEVVLKDLFKRRTGFDCTEVTLVGCG